LNAEGAKDSQRAQKKSGEKRTAKKQKQKQKQKNRKIETVI
jgi:hypothetical protein